MNAQASLLTLAAAGLAALVVFELSPQSAAISDAVMPSSQLSILPPPAPSQSFDPAALADTLLARPLFIQTRHPPAAAGPAASAPSTVTSLPRMTGILIDGARRSAIFAAPSGEPGGKSTIVAEGGRIGLFTVQTIEPQQVIVIGPEGKRTVRTSFDPTPQPPAAPSPYGLAAPQFPGLAPGIATPGISSLIRPPTASNHGYGLSLSAGAAR